MGRKPPIDIIKYPFSRDAELDRAFSSPGIIHDITQNLLKDHVDGWKDLPPLKSSTSLKKYKGLRNVSAVKDAVTKLGVSIAQSQWAGHKTLVLGGGHTQGIATIKASALIYIIRAIMAGKIPVKKTKTTDPKKILRDLADQGDIEGLCRALEKLIESRHIGKKSVADLASTIAVIWLDSHPDYNDRHTTLSGNIHGMALAATTGRDIGGIENLFCGQYIRINPDNIYVLCARDIDPDERILMDKDGVHYKEWELTRPGAMRTVTAPASPVTLKMALGKVFKRIGKKPIIFSMDIDAIHAGIHESPYGHESVAATGTPMGLKPRDIGELFRANFDGLFNESDESGIIRLNDGGQSPPGPSAGDVFEAVQGILLKNNVLAADLSEISPAAGEQGHPVAEEYRGLTLQTSMKVLAAMVGADLGAFTKALKKKRGKISDCVRKAMDKEKSASKNDRRSH